MEPWRLSRELLVPAETITGSRLETEGKKKKRPTLPHSAGSPFSLGGRGRAACVNPVSSGIPGKLAHCGAFW